MNEGLPGAAGMRRLAIALVPALVVVLHAAPEGNLAPAVARTALGERWVAPGTGFSIRPPQGWEVLPQPAPGVSVAFRGPREGDFAPSINVAVLPTPLAITPQAIRRTVDELQAQFGGDSPPPLAKGLPAEAPPISNYRVTNARMVTLFGANAGFLESNYDQGKGNGLIHIRNFQVIVSGPGCHYVLTYTAPADLYDRFVNDAHDSVNSFVAGAGPEAARPPEKRWYEMGQVVGTLLGMVVLIGFMIFLMRWARRRSR